MFILSLRDFPNAKKEAAVTTSNDGAGCWIISSNDTRGHVGPLTRRALDEFLFAGVRLERDYPLSPFTAFEREPEGGE